MTRFLKGNSENLPLKRRLRSEMTRAESHLWLKLRARQFYSLKFRRQHGVGPYIVDFYCPERSVVIEIDGDIHAAADQVLQDRKREEDLQSLGVKVIRYTNNEVMTNLEGILEDLRKKLSP